MSEISCEVEVGDAFFNRDMTAVGVVRTVHATGDVSLDWALSADPNKILGMTFYRAVHVAQDLERGLLVLCERDFL